MHAVEADGDWATRSVSTGESAKTYKARDLLGQVAEAAHQCGDPGLQFDTTINTWHTAKESGRIHASNPCSEYLFLDDSACNLASINLLKFLDDEGQSILPDSGTRFAPSSSLRKFWWTGPVIRRQ